MINVKEKIYTKTKNINSTIKKKGIFKKIAISSVLLFSAMTTWDLAVTASNIIQTKTLADYKYNYYNSLEDYNTLKNKINSVPYTDADFKRDLTLFSYIYGKDKDSEGFRKKFIKKYGANNANIILYMNIRYNTPDKMAKEIIDYTKNIPIEQIDEWENHEKINNDISDISRKYLKDFSLDTKNKDKLLNTLNLIQLKKLERYGNSLPDDKIYDNFSKILSSKGFNPYYFFLSKENINKESNLYKNNITEFEKEKILTDLRNQVNKNNDLAIQYYKDGNLEKLRELFRLGNGFSQVIIKDPSKKAIDINISYQSTFFALYFLNSLGFTDEKQMMYFDSAKQASVYAKYTGQMKPGQEKYYESFSSLFYSM